jgi:curved DNA-binding protein CbpA
MPSTYNPSAKRRSTRVGEAVFFRVSGVDPSGKPFVEETATVYLSFHGCSYFSRHAGPKNSWLSIEIPNPQKDAAPRKLRARIVWNRQSKKLPGLSQVGVEFDAPGNVWGLASPPEDWRQGQGKAAIPIATDIPKATPKEPGTTAVEPRMNETYVEMKPNLEPKVTFESEMKALQAIAATGTYYQLLQVTPDSPLSQVRRNYHELARKCHPDRHMDHPERVQPLQNLMHTVTLAYKTLSDTADRAEYDRRLVASGIFSLGRHKSELEQTTEECVAEAQKCFRAMNYGGSILWLRRAIDIDPASSRYHTLLARSLSAVPMYRREALEHLEKAVGLDPSNIPAHLRLGELYEEMQLPWRARPHYQKVLELDAANSDAQERLLLLDAAEGKNGIRKRTFIDHLLGRKSE